MKPLLLTAAFCALALSSAAAIVHYQTNPFGLSIEAESGPHLRMYATRLEVVPIPYSEPYLQIIATAADGTTWVVQSEDTVTIKVQAR